jgi:anti-sigma B factor antagonist
MRQRLGGLTVMQINKEHNGDSLVLKLEGRLDATTAPQLEELAKAELDGVASVALDFADLEYISSAGLRVLLTMQKKMSGKNGKMTIKNVCDNIQEVFEMTGFSTILNII